MRFPGGEVRIRSRGRGVRSLGGGQSDRGVGSSAGSFSAKAEDRVLQVSESRGGPRTARHRRELRSQTIKTWQARFTDERKCYGGEITNVLGLRVGVTET